MSRPGLALAVALSLAFSALGCAGTTPEAEDAANASPKEAAAPTVKAAPGHILRADVDHALLQGPSWVLQRVVPKEVLRGGAFVGWQIIAMPDDWTGSGLKPGDVVMKVNGVPIEHPEDLWKAWVALMTASELAVAYERDGAAKQLTMPIDGAPTLTEATFQSKAAAASQGGRGRAESDTRRGTIVIPGEPPPDDATEYPAP